MQTIFKKKFEKFSDAAVMARFPHDTRAGERRISELTRSNAARGQQSWSVVAKFCGEERNNDNNNKNNIENNKKTKAKKTKKKTKKI